VLAHGAARVQPVAGGKAPSEEQSKDVLWLSSDEMKVKKTILSTDSQWD